MRKTYLWIAAAFLVAALAGWMSLPSADGKQTFSGTYDWSNGGSDELTAEFKPDGEGNWTVKFKFDFSGDGYTWQGTAEASLEDGSSLTGTASWDRNGRTWVFNGSIEEGVLTGTHAEVRNGKQSESGTFELSR